MNTIKTLTESSPVAWSAIAATLDSNFTELLNADSTLTKKFEGYQVKGEYLTASAITGKLDVTQYNEDKRSFALKSEIPSLEGYALQSQITEQIPTRLNQLTEDETHRFVSDIEKTTWNAKQDKGDYALNSSLSAKADKTDLGGLKFWKGTQQAYEAISVKDANTLYIIIK